MARDKTDETDLTPVATPATSATPKKRTPQETFSKIYWAYINANPPNSLPGQAAQIGSIAMKWIETRDTSFMDAAISYCHQQKLPILPELLEHVHAAMIVRVNDGNSPKKAFAYSAREKLFEEMAKLIYHGATLPHAAELAAYYSHTETAFPMKASTLQKEYPKHSERLVKFTQLIFEDPRLTMDEVAETKRNFEAVIRRKFPLTKQMKGERR
jgi:hypothetical protein